MKRATDPRHLSRELALQSLFSKDFANGNEDGFIDFDVKDLSVIDEIDSYNEELYEALVTGVRERKNEIDSIIIKFAPQWPISQMKLVDLQILRMSIFEGFVGKVTPPKVAIDEAIELAKEFGFSRDLKPYPSLALGTAVATVEENVTAFNVFASHGYYVKSFLIEWVKNRKGKKIFSHVLYRKKILDDITNSKMINALSVFMKRKKKFWPEEHWLDVEVIGKTGSTNNSTSNWYVGSTPKLTTAVYVGRDDGQGMGQYIYSSQTTYPIWFNFNKKIKSDEPNFYVDPSLKEIDIDWLTGQPSLEEDINTITILK